MFHECFYKKNRLACRIVLHVFLHKTSPMFICLLQNLHKKVTSKPTSQPHHHKLYRNTRSAMSSRISRWPTPLGNGGRSGGVSDRPTNITVRHQRSGEIPYHNQLTKMMDLFLDLFFFFNEVGWVGCVFFDCWLLKHSLDHFGERNDRR